MNWIGASITALVAIALLGGGRSIATTALLAAVLYLPQQQSLAIGGITVTALRLVEIIALIRVATRGEFQAVAWGPLDKLFCATYLYTMIVFVLRSNVAVQETLGWATDSILVYAILRALVRCEEDLARVAAQLLFILPPFLLLITVEMQTGRNPFAALGTWTSWVELREGRVRAMGTFRNPSLLGTLGASLLPIYIALFWRPGARSTALLGLLACGYIVYAANSGGPISAMAVGILGWLLWSVRSHMRLLRLTSLFALIAIGLAMDAPIWYLLERMSAITGGSGWHRAHLLSMAWQDLGKWWIAGMPLSETVPWFPYTLGLTGTADITNAFVDFGLKGGLPALALFVWLIAKGFNAVGSALDHRQAEQSEPWRQYLLWGLGCVLAVHVATWFDITYFDQTFVLWVLDVAAIASLAQATRSTQPTHAGQPLARSEIQPPASLDSSLAHAVFHPHHSVPPAS